MHNSVHCFHAIVYIKMQQSTITLWQQNKYYQCVSSTIFTKIYAGQKHTQNIWHVNTKYFHAQKCTLLSCISAHKNVHKNATANHHLTAKYYHVLVSSTTFTKNTKDKSIYPKIQQAKVQNQNFRSKQNKNCTGIDDTTTTLPTIQTLPIMFFHLSIYVLRVYLPSYQVLKEPHSATKYQKPST